MGADVLAVAGSSMTSRAALLAAMVSSAIAAGCDKNCQDTCAHIYEQGECGVIVPGVDVKKLRDDCETACQDALKEAGEMGSYDPYTRADPSNPPELENERQAAEWMNCVWSVDCSELDPSSGICAPI